MIKEIKIENFKSIQSLNLELGRLNVFIGANGSGKSNILEGIAFGAAAIGDRLENLFLSARGVRISEPNLMLPAFKKTVEDSTFFFNYGKNETLKIRLAFNGKWQKGLMLDKEDSSILMENEFAQTISLNQEGKLYFKDKSFERGEKLPDDLINKWQDMLESQSDRLKRFLFESNLSDYMIFAPENTALRRFEEEGQIEPLNIDGKGLFKLLQKTIKQKPEYFAKINEHLQLLDWFEGFEIPNDLMFTERRIKIKDQFLEDGVQYIDQRSANEGFLYLLFYLTLFISDETPKFFAIDNIDNAMNPKLGRELIKLLAKLAEEHDKQVILTTHNPAILDGLNLNDDMQRLFVISRNAEGHTKALRIQKDPVEKDKIPVKLSEQFLRGYIGGLNF
jgi:AAA15 family ATPase/GTPase